MGGIEACQGLALLPKSRRQAQEAAFARMLSEGPENRALNFDSAAAAEAASLAAIRQKAGRALDVHDTLITGIALARRATLATRVERHFLHLKLPLLKPWKITKR